MWSETPGKLWKVGETAEGGARENPAFPPFFRLAVASIRRCCTCVPGVFDQMREQALERARVEHVDRGRIAVADREPLAVGREGDPVGPLAARRPGRVQQAQ